jgi:hypothetical protein
MHSLQGAAKGVVAMAHFDAAEIEDPPIGSVCFRYRARARNEPVCGLSHPTMIVM